MELNQAARRIVGQHWLLIVICVLGGAVAAAVVHIGGTKTYTATARLVLDTQDPKSRAESMAIADTGRAIATSSSQVGAALAASNIVNRDPIEVGEKHVSVSALGTSAILKLSVSDRDPRIAAVIANALAARVIQTRLDASNGRAAQTRGDLERRIAALSQQIVKSGVEARQVLLQQRGALESELAVVMASNVTRPAPLVISRAATPTRADASQIPTDAALGAVLGLILGIGLAGLAELIRPTLVGGTALAEEMGTLFLGALPQEPSRVMTGLRLATRAADVRDVGLIAVGNYVDLETIAGGLEAMDAKVEPISNGASGAATSAAHTDGESNGEAKRVTAMRQTLESRRGQPLDSRRKPRTAGALQIRPYTLNNGSARTKDATGLILVTREAVSKSDLDEAGQLLSITGLPVLGLITIANGGLKREPRSGTAARDAAEVRARAEA